MELHNILNNNRGKKGRFKRCTENFFTLNMFTGRFFIPKFRKRKIWKSFDSLKSMGGNVEIIIYELKKRKVTKELLGLF